MPSVLFNRLAAARIILDTLCLAVDNFGLLPGPLQSSGCRMLHPRHPSLCRRQLQHPHLPCHCHLHFLCITVDAQTPQALQISTTAWISLLLAFVQRGKIAQKLCDSVTKLALGLPPDLVSSQTVLHRHDCTPAPSSTPAISLGSAPGYSPVTPSFRPTTSIFSAPPPGRSRSPPAMSPASIATPMSGFASARGLFSRLRLKPLPPHHGSVAGCEGEIEQERRRRGRGRRSRPPGSRLLGRRTEEEEEEKGEAVGFGAAEREKKKKKRKEEEEEAAEKKKKEKEEEEEEGRRRKRHGC